MSDPIKHENTTAHGSYEHQDLGPKAILYFLLALGVAVVISFLGLRAVYAYLDHRETADQPPMSPLVTNVPTDTRHIAPGYPQTAFPSPRLEDDERGQLNGFLTSEQKTLYSYGWVDEPAGTVHIPIERAMELLVQRGLPVRPQGSTTGVAAPNPANKKKDKKK